MAIHDLFCGLIKHGLATSQRDCWIRFDEYLRGRKNMDVQSPQSKEVLKGIQDIREFRDFVEQLESSESQCAVALDMAIAELGKTNLESEIVNAAREFVKWIRETNQRVPEYG